MGAVGTIDNISPISKLTDGLAEWSVPGSRDVGEPQGGQHDVRVGRSRAGKPPEAEPSDATATEGNHEVSQVSVDNCYIQFVVDHESKEVTAKVIDRASGEVVRTIPPEELARCVQGSRMAPGTYLEALL